MRMRIDMNANVLAQTVKPNRFIKMSVRWESILFGSLLFFSIIFVVVVACKKEYITVCLSNIHIAWMNNHGASYHFIFALLFPLIICVSLWLCRFHSNSTLPQSSPFGFNFDFNRLARVYLCIAHEKKSISLLLCKFRLFNICCVACGGFLMGNKILIVSVVAMLRRNVAIILLLICTTIT